MSLGSASGPAGGRASLTSVIFWRRASEAEMLDAGALQRGQVQGKPCLDSRAVRRSLWGSSEKPSTERLEGSWGGKGGEGQAYS